MNHELLLKLLYKLCGDKPLVALVRNCLLSQPHKFRIDGGGLFQGMILSSFLNNLYLHQLEFKYKFVGKRLPNIDGFWESLVGRKPEPEHYGNIVIELNHKCIIIDRYYFGRSRCFFVNKI